jgi:hypothetical protein
MLICQENRPLPDSEIDAGGAELSAAALWEDQLAYSRTVALLRSFQLAEGLSYHDPSSSNVVTRVNVVFISWVSMET